MVLEATEACGKAGHLWLAPGRKLSLNGTGQQPGFGAHRGPAMQLSLLRGQTSFHKQGGFVGCVWVGGG